MQVGNGIELAGLQGDGPVGRVNHQARNGKGLVAAVHVQVIALNHIHVADCINAVFRYIGGAVVLVHNSQPCDAAEISAGSRKLGIEIGGNQVKGPAGELDVLGVVNGSGEAHGTEAAGRKCAAAAIAHSGHGCRPGLTIIPGLYCNGVAVRKAGHVRGNGTIGLHQEGQHSVVYPGTHT